MTKAFAIVVLVLCLVLDIIACGIGWWSLALFGGVVAYDTLLRPRTGVRFVWDPEAERRLDNVPAPVRAMARVVLERTAAERGSARITVSLMEEVKAKYFGMGAQKA